MRYQEIFEFAPNIPQKYLIDDETDLALNAPNQWTQSPYLGAVKAPTGNGYVAQIHIPQHVWVEMVEQNPAKWQNAPKTFFNSVGNQRPSMRVRFDDPRQAAWFSQEVLYGGDWQPRDIIEDFFEELYCGGDGELWRHVKAQVPTYDGTPLTSDDEQSYFADPEAFRKKAQVAKNTSEYERTMPIKIKKALVDFFDKNQQLARKRLGKKFKSRAELERVIDQIVDQKGIEYFVTAPGSVKLKDIASITFK